MAITCPKCGSQFDATLFEFGHRVRCDCGAEVEYPGTGLRAGHVVARAEDATIAHEDRYLGSTQAASGQSQQDSQRLFQIAQVRQPSNLSWTWTGLGSLRVNGQTRN